MTIGQVMRMKFMLEGEPDATGITNVDFVDLLLYYSLL